MLIKQTPEEIQEKINAYKDKYAEFDKKQKRITEINELVLDLHCEYTSLINDRQREVHDMKRDLAEIMRDIVQFTELPNPNMVGHYMENETLSILDHIMGIAKKEQKNEKA